MSFVTQLLHALQDFSPASAPSLVTCFLPKNADEAALYPLSLLYPLASGHIHMPTDLSLSFSPLPSYAILSVTSGNGTLISGKQRYALSHSTFVLFDLQDGFSLSSSADLEYDILYYNGTSATQFYQELAKNGGLYLSSLTGTGIRSLLLPLLSPYSDTLSAFQFHRFLTNLLCELIDNSSTDRNKKTIPAYLRKIKIFIDENYKNAISLDSLAQHFSINRYRLCREFKVFYFYPPIQYMHNVRISQARTYLEESSLKVHEISDLVGYENTNHFIHHFKKITGLTPQAYRSKKHPAHSS